MVRTEAGRGEPRAPCPAFRGSALPTPSMPRLWVLGKGRLLLARQGTPAQAPGQSQERHTVKELGACTPCEFRERSLPL